MNQRILWKDIVQCYRANIEVLFGNLILFSVLWAVGILLVWGVLHVLLPFTSELFGQISWKRFISVLKGDIHFYDIFTFFSLLLCALLAPYFAWLMYGWHRFMLRLVRSGCNEYHLIYSTPLKRLLPALGLFLFYMPLIWMGKLAFRLPNVWQVASVCVLLTVVLSRILFAWYYLIDGHSLASALAQSNRRAHKYPIATLLAAALLIILSGWSRKGRLFESGTTIAPEFISGLITVAIGIGSAFVALFFDYLIARLYAETGCKTYKDCSEKS